MTTDHHGVTRITLRRGDGPHLILTLNRQLRDVDAAAVRSIPRRSATGQPVLDWLYRPPSRPDGRLPPLVVSPYPGVVYTSEPAGQALGAPAPSISAQLLTSHGFAVLEPSLPRAADALASSGLVADILAVVDGASRTGRVDSGRVAVWGHSFGGYAALVLATRSTRFRAVVAQAAPADLFSLHGVFSASVRARPQQIQLRDFGMGWSEGGQGDLGGPPSREAATFLRESPAFDAEAVSAPVLLIAGDQDFVDASQSEEMFSALRRYDKDVKLLIFPGENHEMASPADYAAVQRAVFAFLDHAFSP